MLHLFNVSCHASPAERESDGASRTDARRPSPLRVAHVLESFAIGGGERIALEIASSHTNRRDLVWAVSFSSTRGSLAVEFERRGVETLVIAKAPGIDLTLVPRLARWLVKERVDIVHVHHPLSRIYAGLAARLVGVRRIATMHGEAPDRWRRMVLRRSAAKLFDAFVVVSPALADAARLREAADDDNICLIESGVDAERFHPDADDRAAVRAELGLAPNDWVIGTAARLSPEKDQAMLLEAVAPLVALGARLVIAGDGPERKKLEARADELHMTGTQFVGMVPDVARFLRALDVFALSSRREGLPMAVLEAMATALPVVSTAVGGVPRAITDGETGLLVPARDAIAMTAALRTLMTTPSFARALGANARRVAIDKFSSHRMLAEYAQLYERIMGRQA